MTRLIDAEKLKKHYAWWEDDERRHLFDQIVDAQPTVEAEPVRHGMFIGTEYDGYADGYPVYYEWKCSECGCVFEEEEPTYRYCPHCGARMDGNDTKGD